MNKNKSILRFSLYALTIYAITTLFQSCSSYQQVEFNSEHDHNVLITTERKVNLGANCSSKEIVTKTDTLKNQMLYKEERIYDCKGAYSYLTKTTTWSQIDGKLKKTVVEN